MAEFETKCPHCDASLTAQTGWVGMISECPACKQNFTITQESSAEPPPMPPLPEIPDVPPVPKTENNMPHTEYSNKTRIAYLLLGIFLGAWGIHDFYAGYTQRGIIKVIIAVLGCCLWGGTVSWIWAIVDVCTIREDVNGRPFAG